MKRVLAIAVGIVLAAGGSGADEILLRNGNIIQGQVLSEDAEKVVINIPFGKQEDGRERYVRMTFPRDRVSRVTRRRSIFDEEREPVYGEKESETDRGKTEPAKPEAEESPAPQPASAAEPAAETGGEAAEENGGDKDEEEKKEPEIDPALQAQIDALIKDLLSTKPEVRGPAENRLVAIGKDAVPSVVRALMESDSRLQGIGLCQVLRRIGDKRATRALIDELDQGQYMTRRMGSAYRALKAITGQDIFFDEDSMLRERQSRQQDWLNWFEGVKDDYPEQIGFEEKKEEGGKEE